MEGPTSRAAAWAMGPQKATGPPQVHIFQLQVGAGQADVCL